MFLKSENIYLRALEPADLAFLYDLENDRELWPVSNTNTPYSRYVLQQYIEQAAADIYSAKQLRLLVCTHQHQPVGTIDLFDFDPAHQRAGVGISIAGAFRQRYFATEALVLLLYYVREDIQLHQVYCSVTATNVASLKLFARAGFEKIGTRRQWLKTPVGWQDVVELQKFLSVEDANSLKV